MEYVISRGFADRRREAEGGNDKRHRELQSAKCVFDVHKMWPAHLLPTSSIRGAMMCVMYCQADS